MTKRKMAAALVNINTITQQKRKQDRESFTYGRDSLYFCFSMDLESFCVVGVSANIVITVFLSKIDGAGPFQIYWKMLLPNIRPICYNGSCSYDDEADDHYFYSVQKQFIKGMTMSGIK